MYNYHNVLKKRLKSEPFTVSVAEPNNKGWVYRFNFKDKSYPIKNFRLEEYEEYLKIKKNEDH